MAILLTILMSLGLVANSNVTINNTAVNQKTINTWEASTTPVTGNGITPIDPAVNPSTRWKHSYKSSWCI